MRKYLAALLILASSAPALADGYYNGRHRHEQRFYQYQPQHFYRPPPSAVLGVPAVGDRYYYSRPLPPGCWREQVGFDYMGRGIWETYC